MKRLGYTRYVAQGGDWGAVVVDVMAAQGHPGADRHPHQHARRGSARDRQGALGRQPGAVGTLGRGEARVRELEVTYKNVQYAFYMASRPQTLTALTDSPVGLATFMLDHDPRSLELIARSFDGHPEGLSRDDVLDNVTYFWLTNTAVSAARLYWENKLNYFSRQERPHPGRGERLPRRAVPGAAELDGGGVSQAHPLQQAPQGRALRGVGTTEVLRGRAPRGIQVAA